MARSRNPKSRPPERDYSHRSLLDKLGVKPEHRIAALGIADENFLCGLAARCGVRFSNRPAHESDLIFYATENKRDLARLKFLEASMKRNGAIWVVYPKGQTHIRETDVIAAGKAAGFVDNKVIRFSDTHTSLRLVIPLVRR